MPQFLLLTSYLCAAHNSCPLLHACTGCSRPTSQALQHMTAGLSPLQAIMTCLCRVMRRSSCAAGLTAANLLQGCGPALQPHRSGVLGDQPQQVSHPHVLLVALPSVVVAVCLALQAGELTPEERQVPPACGLLPLGVHQAWRQSH